MKQIMPDSTEKEQTAQARIWYQEDVINYIKNHPEKIKLQIKNKLENLKEKYKLIPVTTNSKDHINEILKVSNLENIYYGIVASKTNEEPDKQELVDELIKNYGKPKFYLTQNTDKEIIDKFKELEVKVLSVDEVEKL